MTSPTNLGWKVMPSVDLPTSEGGSKLIRKPSSTPHLTTSDTQDLVSFGGDSGTPCQFRTVLKTPDRLHEYVYMY